MPERSGIVDNELIASHRFVLDEFRRSCGPLFFRDIEDPDVALCKTETQDRLGLPAFCETFVIRIWKRRPNGFSLGISKTAFNNAFNFGPRLGDILLTSYTSRRLLLHMADASVNIVWVTVEIPM